MTADTLRAEQPDALDLEDELLDFTADLLSLKAYQPFLTALFAQPSGKWINVRSISVASNSDRAADRQTAETLDALEAAGQGRLQVTWLHHPETSDAYCLVLFFMESIGWDNLAIYHRALLVTANR